ncbi:ABC transporter ATP-binding protein [Desulfotomaculum defluvii]
MIELININKVYKDAFKQNQVLININLSVKENEYISIMGSSGSGKTTLLNILGCLDTPTSGAYLFRGQDLVKYNSGQLAKFRNQNIGFVFQNFWLLPRDSIYSNVELPLLYANISARERKNRVFSALEQVGLLAKVNSYPTQLSGGQRQKVAIARAIVGKPSILLADEPTGNLDSHSTEEVLKIFDNLNHTGTSIIMVTHDQKVAHHAQRIITMDKFQGRFLSFDHKNN